MAYSVAPNPWVIVDVFAPPFEHQLDLGIEDWLLGCEPQVFTRWWNMVAVQSPTGAV
jgi:hypothetical protein